MTVYAQALDWACSHPQRMTELLGRFTTVERTEGPTGAKGYIITEYRQSRINREGN